MPSNKKFYLWATIYKLITSSKKFYLWAAMYKIVFELVYFLLISPIYSYFGLVWKPNLLYFFISYFLFFILLLCLPNDDGRPSHQLISLLFFITVVPILSFFWQASQSIHYVLYVFLCYLLLSLLLRLSKPIKIPLICIGRIGRNDKLGINKYLNFVNFVAVISFLLLILYSIQNNSIDLRTLSFSDVYSVREEIKYNMVWSYLTEWLGRLLIPFCIVLSIFERKYRMLFFSSLMQIYLYLCTGQKTTLFSVLFLVFFSLLLKKGKFKLGVPIFYTVAVIGSSLFYIITKNLFSIGIFPVRHLNIPAYLNFVHYDFFSSNKKLWFSEGLIGKILGLNYPYDIPSTFLVSPVKEMNANTGFLADAYDNGGLLIMVFYTLILGLIFLFIDSISQISIERYKYTALMLYTVIILNDGGLLTTLLTSGSGILLIFLYILASEENKAT